MQFFLKKDDRQLLLKTLNDLETGMLHDCNLLPIFTSNTPIGKCKGTPKYKNDPIWDTGNRNECGKEAEEDNDLANMVWIKLIFYFANDYMPIVKQSIWVVI